jgi:uncharacterized protein (TIGR03067 family)
MADSLAGTWHAVYAEQGGEMAAAAYVSTIELTYSGNKFSVNVEGQLAHEGTYTINDKTVPHQITLVYTKSSHFELNKPRHGIFQLNGETYKDCFGTIGGHAPASFDTTPKSNSGYTIFQRKGSEGGVVVPDSKIGVNHLW